MLCHVMFCQIVLLYVILSYIVLLHVILSYIVLLHVILSYIMLLHVILSYIVLLHVILSYIMFCDGFVLTSTSIFVFFFSFFDFFLLLGGERWSFCWMSVVRSSSLVFRRIWIRADRSWFIWRKEEVDKSS